MSSGVHKKFRSPTAINYFFLVKSGVCYIYQVLLSITRELRNISGNDEKRINFLTADYLGF